MSETAPLQVHSWLSEQDGVTVVLDVRRIFEGRNKELFRKKNVLSTILPRLKKKKHFKIKM